VFSFRYRGNETRVGIDYDEEAKLTDQQARDAMHLCPTGAIIVRGEMHARPFGDRQFDMRSMQHEDTAEEPVIVLPKEKKLLDIDLKILDLIEIVELHKSPLNDIKKFTRQCDIGLIEGGCCNSENVESLKEFRRNCDVLVAFGECAIWGGLPAMRNTIPLGECLEEAYLNGISAMPDDCEVPYHEDLPKILDKVYACSEIVDIDHFIPGCPPDADHIWRSVLSLLSDQQLPVPYSEFKYD